MKRTAVILLGLLGLLGWGCGGGGDDDRAIVIGSKLDTEAQVLGHLMAEQLKAKGYSVRTKIPLGGTDIVRKALTSKRIDVYWEFTGSGLNLLEQRPIGDPQAAYAKVKELDAANGVTWLPAARLNDTYALAVKGDGPIAARTLSELSATVRSQPGAKLCVDPEGGFREDVLPVLGSVYGITFGDPTQLGHSLIPPARGGRPLHGGHRVLDNSPDREARPPGARGRQGRLRRLHTGADRADVSAVPLADPGR